MILNAVKTSVAAAAGTAVIATILGTFAGIALARRKGKWTAVFLLLVFLILVTPEIVDAIALLIWYVRIGGPFGPDLTIPAISYGMLRLWVGHSLFATAVVTLIVRARLEGLEESLEEAAADLYAPPGRRFRQITLPLMLPAVLAGALLAFSFSLDDTIISSFVSAAGASPWPVVVFSSLRSVLRPEIASVSTLLLLLTLFAIACVALVLRRGGQSSEEVAKTMTGRRLARQPRQQHPQREQRHRERHPSERSLGCRPERSGVDRLDVAVARRDRSLDRRDADVAAV